MRLASETKNDIKAVQKMRLPWWGVLCWMAACALIVWPFYRSGRLDLAKPVLYCIGIVGVVIAIKWKLRRHVWFWIIMAILAALHVLFILFVPWTAKWIPALVVIPIAIGDFYVMLWVLMVVKKIHGGTNGPSW